MKVDYADWLTSARFEREESLWEESKLYVRYANAIRRVLLESQTVTTVLEFGAGSGWVPTQLADLNLSSYTLVDRNVWCLEAARERHKERPWVRIVSGEIRDLVPVADLVCGFAVLKHFRLQEWQALFARLFGEADYGLFTIPIAKSVVEDQGEEFVHSRVSESFLATALDLAGVQELWRDNTDAEEPLIAVARKK